MFREIPELSNVTGNFINNRFELFLTLSGPLSSTPKPYSNFGVLVHVSNNKIQNFKPSFELTKEQNSFLLFLDKDESAVINNQIVTYIQNVFVSSENENIYMYATPFVFNSSFLKKRNKLLSYRFSKPVETSLRINNQINSNVIFDYSVINKIQNLSVQQLEQKLPISMAISEMFTSFIDEKTVTNFIMINHLLLSKQQNDPISNIIDYESKLLYTLLIPNIYISKNNKKIEYNLSSFNKIDLLSFTDTYDSSDPYKIAIRYYFANIRNYITNLINNYKKTNSKKDELYLLNFFNLDRQTLRDYLLFIQKYNSNKNKIEYNFNRLFDDILKYIGVKNYASNTKQAPTKTIGKYYESEFMINVPFQKEKHIKLSPFSLVDNEFVANAEQVKYNNEVITLANNKDFYNLLFVDQSKPVKPDFNEFINKNSILVITKKKTKPVAKQNIKDNFIEDYKITNQKVTVSEPFAKFPTDKAKLVQLSNFEVQEKDNLSRDLVHSLFGTLEEYKNSDNIKMNYYLEVATFTPKNLKNIKWAKLTPDKIKELPPEQFIFVKVLPNFTQTKQSNNIFTFSYEYVKLLQVGTLLNNAT